MYVVGREDMGLMDRHTIDVIGLPGEVLMENAGAKVAEEVAALFNKEQLSQESLVVVLAGHGNNGGDGFVVARRLADMGYRVLLCLVSRLEKLKGEALLHFRVYQKRGLPLWLLEEHRLEELFEWINQARVVVDALLGTGVQSEVRSPYREVISWLNAHRQGKWIVSVDLPSGLCADTGRILGEAVKATHTITMACPKKGFFLQEGPKLVGEWKTVDISIPLSLVETLKLDVPRLITPADVARALPKRPPDGHKGTFGHVLVVGGSPNYVGAPLLTALAALESGAGLVTLAVPEPVYPYLAAQSPLPIYLSLPTDQNGLGRKSLEILESRMDNYDLLVVGPGLGRWPKGEEWLAQLLKKWHGPALIDADGLNLLHPLLSEDVLEREHPWVLTPHPGEMARLMGTTVQKVEEDRLGAARHLAQEKNVYLILKGHRTVLASPEGELWINPRGHNALGKGGAGDILAGMTAAFMAQGASPLQAGIAAVYLHALTGEQCALNKSTYGVVATDLLSHLGQALLSIMNIK
jgi:NAD(P)H-hydrate epimerase